MTILVISLSVYKTKREPSPSVANATARGDPLFRAFSVAIFRLHPIYTSFDLLCKEGMWITIQMI